MNGSAVFFISVWLKFFFLFTPFFAVSMFLSMTQGQTERQRRKLALRVSGAAAVLCMALFFFGQIIFALFGVTLDAFRVGAGALLFLAAVGLVHGNLAGALGVPEEDIAVVPLAMPVIVGPAATGALLVLGAEMTAPHLKALGCLALLLAISAVSAILYLASAIERAVGKRGLSILSKITGLMLAALAAQMILTGACRALARGAPGNDDEPAAPHVSAPAMERAGPAHQPPTGLKRTKAEAFTVGKQPVRPGLLHACHSGKTGGALGAVWPRCVALDLNNKPATLPPTGG